MRIGQKIASMRKGARLSQEEFAEKLFVSRELVSKWETNKRKPTYQMIIEISKLLKISTDELLDINDSVIEELSNCIPNNLELSQEEFTEILNKFLITLSKTERLIFISRYYYGQTSSQISSLIGLKSNNIRKHLMILREKFTNSIKEYENEQ